MEPTAHPTAEQTRPVRRLTRTRDGRWFGGVCSGLGRYFDVNPAIYRLAFVALALAGGTGLLLYLAAWLVIPDEGRDASLAEEALRDHRDRPGLAVGLGLLAFAAIIVFSHAAFWPGPGNLWLAALLVGGGLVWWELHGRQPVAAGGGPTTAGTTQPPAPRPTRGPSLFLPVVGALLAAAGVLGLLEALAATSIDWRIALGVAVVVVGAAIVVGAALGRRVAGLAGLGVLLLAAFVLAHSLDVPLRGGVGDRTVNPAAVESISPQYRLAIGTLTVDLRDVQLHAGEKRVRASVGVGELVVYVPADTTVDVTGRARAGDVVLFGSHESGLRVERHQISEGTGAGRLVLDLEVGVGDVEVRRG
jgi:phage shock protein PspC (stress-responsive transcriptional regulator)